MKVKGNGIIGTVFRLVIVCAMLAVMSSAVFADDSSDALRDKGVQELNSAYEYTIRTGGDAVGASAGMSFGGWSSLGSKLSYMEFPEGAVGANGETGLWCYCIDITTGTKNGHKYSVTTLDAAEYYEDSVSGKIRAILINSYPYVSVDGLENRFDLMGLTEEEAFIATQWILWYYSNPDGLVEAGENTYYPANIYKPSEYPKETIRIWYDDENGNEVSAQSSNVVNLAKALDELQPEGTYETEPVNIVVEKRIYDDKVIFDFGNTENLDDLQNLSIIVKDANGEEVHFASSGDKIVVLLEDLVMDEFGAGISVEINAEQMLKEDVYFFSPEGGRSASQSRVAVFSGVAPVAYAANFGLPRSEFDGADEDAQLKVTKKVLYNGEAHRSENIYYVALFEDEACTLPAFNGDVREIRMGGEAEGSAVFDELVPDKTYYVAETDVNGKPLKDGDMGIAVITYDKRGVAVEAGAVAEVTIINCYEDYVEPVDDEDGKVPEEDPKDEDEPGGGLGDGDGEEPGDKEDKQSGELDKAPDTGDNTNTWFLMAMALLMNIAMIGAVSVVLAGRRG
ncbi:MAG: Cys-Gln thioester bond-forming surface protein [Firmicutes bacterium]|nr:Cys-Gln thioester bond-forming surface protein [Bacillota bacterium]MBR6798466.1 Cys-Gln thioester bond-forming surface protein [Bacillota bacterium]